MTPDLPGLLILDDDAAVRGSLEAYFEDRGWPVFAADSAEAALDLIEAEQVGVAIVDIRLGGMSGDAFIREALGRTPGLRCIVCTGSPDYEMAETMRRQPRVSPTIFHKPLPSLMDLELEVIRMAALQIPDHA